MGNITGEVDRLLFSLPLVAVNRLAEFHISLCEHFSFFFEHRLPEMDVPETQTLCRPSELRSENSFLRWREGQAE